MILAAAALAVHLAATTSLAAAQAQIDEGLFFYYAYNRQASAAAFSKAAELDPKLAIAYWGEALAAGPDLNTPIDADGFAIAKAAIAKAVALEPGASPSERSLIDAMALRYRGDYSDFAANNDAYRKAMLEAAASSHDVNAELLAVEASLERARPSPTVLALLAGALARDPGNPMANHLCIHAYESATDPSPALPCAQRLDAATFHPAAEHLAHMPAHYWNVAGEYALSEASSERAYGLIVQLEATGDAATPHVNQYLSHDVAIGYAAAMMLGNYANALQWSKRINATDFSFGPFTALRFGRYDIAYGATSNVYGGDAVRALAAMHLGRLSDAQMLKEQATREAQASRHGYLWQLFLARLAEHENQIDRAVRWLQEAQQRQDVDYAFENLPNFPAGEALGGLYLRQKQFQKAVDAFTATLKAYPNDPRALFGLSLAYEGLGRASDAARARAQFDKIWAGADTTLTAGDL